MTAPSRKTTTDVPIEARSALLRQHGRFSQAYSTTFQPGLRYFGDGDGFIGYKPFGRTALALGDPIAPRERQRDMISAFVAAQSDVMFCQVSRPVAEILASMNFTVNEMGLETVIDLAAHSFAGRRNRAWRTATNHVSADGIVIKECDSSEVGVGAMRAVSDHWLRTRSNWGREVRFLNRPIVFEDEPDVRRFFAFDADGAPLAFDFFDPIYEDGRVIGYVHQLKRRLPRLDPLLNYAILRRAIETFQAEGKRILSLGLSPLADIHDKNFTHDWLTRRVFRFMYESPQFNRWIFPFKGHDMHKRLYRGAQEQTYLAMNRRPSLPRLIKLLRACRILPV